MQVQTAAEVEDVVMTTSSVDAEVIPTSDNLEPPAGEIVSNQKVDVAELEPEMQVQTAAEVEDVVMTTSSVDAEVIPTSDNLEPLDVILNVEKQEVCK
jgi:hypothetical protein